MVKRIMRGWRSYDRTFRWVIVLCGTAGIVFAIIPFAIGRPPKWTTFVIPAAVWLIWLPWLTWRRGRSDS
jgi:hypothetical protein